MSATDTAAPQGAAPSPTVQLLRKLREVADAIPYVEKRGQNDHHGYSYVQALDVVRDVRAQLLQRGIVVIPATVPGSVRHFAETGGKGFVTTIDVVYRFMDSDTGVSIEVPWTAAGADVGGDKGLYKAYTGGLKYALLGLFLLPMTEDPEHDALTQPQAQAGGQDRAKDAERPAAPRIPLDRAQAIAEAATGAGLASWEGEGGDRVLSMTPVLKAKLATMGFERIGTLNVDQAEELEAFIRAEAQAAAEAGAAQAEAEAGAR